MALWRVEIFGLVERYIEATDAEVAEARVIQSFVDALELTVRPAHPELVKAYERLRPRQRRLLVLDLDGLSNLVTAASQRTTKRKLERERLYQQEQNEWIERQLAEAPPVNPESVEQLLVMGDFAMRRSIAQRLLSPGEAYKHH
jgi:hypothetical protein